MAVDQGDVSEDAVLGGRLVLRQPRRGHRVGHDAILLAAASHARTGEHAVDLGAGVGAAGLALARRIDGVSVTLVEIDAVLTALARENAERNGLAERVRAICIDVGAPSAAFVAANLKPESVDRVLMNPPFNVSQNPSPSPRRRMAHTATGETLGLWVRTAARLLRPQGIMTLIWRADGLDDVLAVVRANFGTMTVLPVHPKPNTAAIRVLVRAIKGSNGTSSVLPGFVLADVAGRPTAEAEAVLRDGVALPLGES